MKKILLIGDSIRFGYDHYVEQSMKNVAEVYFPTENCKFTTYILRNLHIWTDSLKLYEADAVHWNAGLWDTLRIYGDDNLVKPETYADNIERIYKRIKFLFPAAKQIFATSTPVIEDGYIKNFESRTNEDVEKYNEIACKILVNHNVTINDLYSLLKGNHEKYHSDQSHFYTKEGTVLIGNRVNNVLCETLNLETNKLIMPDMETFSFIKCASDKDVYESYGNIYRTK